MDDEMLKRVQRNINMDDGVPCWELIIAIKAIDLKALRWTLDHIIKNIRNQNDPKKMGSSGAGSGEDNFTDRYIVICKGPIEVEIKELRARADELEKKLKGGGDD